MFHFFLVSSDLINDRYLIDQSLKRFSSFLALHICCLFIEITYFLRQSYALSNY